MLTHILTVLFLILFTNFVWKRYQTYRVFKDRGIPGPSPNFLLGNMLDLLDGPSRAIGKWEKQYGKTFGYFEGSNPILVTSDLEVIKQVMVKEYSKFMSRKPFPFSPDPESDYVSVFLARGKRWKRLRSFMSPMFSSNKMKQTSPLVTAEIETLLELLEDCCAKNQPFDITPYFQGLTMDVICSTAFGLQTNIQRNPDSPLIANSRAVFEQLNFRNEPFYRKALILLSSAFPSLGAVSFNIFMILYRLGIVKFGGFKLGEQIEEVIKDRKERQARGEETRQDFLQFMLDAECDALDVDVDSLSMSQEGTDQKSITSPGTSNMPSTQNQMRPVMKKLKHVDVVTNLFQFMIAGYDATSAALSYAAYHLALNPNIQSRLQKELDDNLQGELATYGSLNKLPYLDMTFNEALRITPVAPSVVNRYCLERNTICGIDIPEGMTIQANVKDIHHDLELWGPVETDVFYPERFSKESKTSRNPFAFLAFGTGPRNCVGLRLAMAEGKLALARILQRFNIERCAETEVPLEKVERLALVPANGIYIKLTNRE